MAGWMDALRQAATIRSAPDGWLPEKSSSAQRTAPALPPAWPRTSEFPAQFDDVTSQVSLSNPEEEVASNRWCGALNPLDFVPLKSRLKKSASQSSEDESCVLDRTNLGGKPMSSDSGMRQNVQEKGETEDSAKGFNVPSLDVHSEQPAVDFSDIFCENFEGINWLETDEIKVEALPKQAVWVRTSSPKASPQENDDESCAEDVAVEPCGNVDNDAGICGWSDVNTCPVNVSSPFHVDVRSCAEELEDFPFQAVDDVSSLAHGQPKFLELPALAEAPALIRFTPAAREDTMATEHFDLEESRKSVLEITDSIDWTNIWDSPENFFSPSKDQQSQSTVYVDSSAQSKVDSHCKTLSAKSPVGPMTPPLKCAAYEVLPEKRTSSAVESTVASIAQLIASISAQVKGDTRISPGGPQPLVQRMDANRERASPLTPSTFTENISRKRRGGPEEHRGNFEVDPRVELCLPVKKLCVDFSRAR